MTQPVLAFVEQQISDAKSELANYRPSEMNWPERARASAAKLIRLLESTAQSVCKPNSISRIVWEDFAIALLFWLAKARLRENGGNCVRCRDGFRGRILTQAKSFAIAHQSA